MSAIWLAKQKVRASLLVAGIPGCHTPAGTVPKKVNNCVCRVISEL